MYGNRGGRFHSDAQLPAARPWASRQWLCCVLSFKSRRRKVWTKGYTELFFLDEVTALAAGHRPCFECRRSDAKRFQACWADSSGAVLRAPQMDVVLHGERLSGRAKRLHRMKLDAMPDGVMIAHEGRSFALRGGEMLAWSFEGYGAAVARSRGMADVLTPPSIIACLARGYRPMWHASAEALPVPLPLVGRG